MAAMKRNAGEVPTVIIGERDNVIRIVLLGKTGAGKSSTGNILAGYDVFPVSKPYNTRSFTDSCSMFLSEIKGRQIHVIDTPGLCDTDKREDAKILEILDVISLASPGAHVFLIVVKTTEKFTSEAVESITKIKDKLGENMMKRAIIVFTGSELDEDYYKTGEFMPSSLKQFVKEVKERCFIINADAMSDRSRIANELFEKIVGYKFHKTKYTNDEFEKADTIIKKEAGTEIVKYMDETMRSMIWRIKTDGDIEGAVVPLTTEEYQRLADNCKEAILSLKTKREQVYPHLQNAHAYTSPGGSIRSTTIAGIICTAGAGIAVIATGGGAIPIGAAILSTVFFGPSLNEKLSKFRVMRDLNKVLKEDLSRMLEIKRAVAESLRKEGRTDHMSRGFPGLKSEFFVGTILDGVVSWWHQGTVQDALTKMESILKEEQAMKPADFLKFVHQKRTLYDRVNKNFFTKQRRGKLYKQNIRKV